MIVYLVFSHCQRGRRFCARVGRSVSSAKGRRARCLFQPKLSINSIFRQNKYHRCENLGVYLSQYTNARVFVVLSGKGNTIASYLTSRLSAWSDAGLLRFNGGKALGLL